MKRFLLCCIFMSMILTSCVGTKVNQAMAEYGLESAELSRVNILSTRYAGKYTLIDKRSMNRVRNVVIKARDAKIDTKLQPDFIFDFFDDTDKLASFKYIAGIDDSDTANLIDEDGHLYHISPSVENEFLKNILKTSNAKNIPEYYESLIEKLLDNDMVKDGSTVVVDISRDDNVMKSILSVDQKEILDTIDKKSIKVMYPGETENWDYTIKIITKKYSGTECQTTAYITGKDDVSKGFSIVGTFKEDVWEYFITFK